MLMTSIFPGRYVQGDGALASLPEEAARLGKRALGIVADPIRATVEKAVAGQKLLEITLERFGNECCDEEIDRLAAMARKIKADVVIGVGGGKTLDTAKAVAHALSVPVVIAPTIASTDAPCSALAVVYTAQGAFKRYLVLPRNPDVVMVDSQVVLGAPVRFLVSGMGDALSTWFEAEDCREAKAANMTGRVGSMTAYGLARLCFDTLMADGAAARKEFDGKAVTPAIERIIEANTLLSGLGFESGGLSGAHAIHNGLTVLPETHKFWHGEKVAIGTLSLLMLTKRPADMIAKVYDFCQAIGLPICLADIGLEHPTDAQLMEVARVACAPEDTIHNIKGDITPEAVCAAIKAADAEGRRRKGK